MIGVSWISSYFLLGPGVAAPVVAARKITVNSEAAWATQGADPVPRTLPFGVGRLGVIALCSGLCLSLGCVACE